MAQLFDSVEDFTHLKSLDAERYDLHYDRYRYFQRYHASALSGVNGQTSVAATRQFIVPAGNMTSSRVGARLRLLSGTDLGEYTVVTVAPGADVTRVTVERDWPAGGQVGISFVVELEDLYGDPLHAKDQQLVERGSPVPICLILDPPEQLIERFDYDQPASGYVEFSRGLHEAAPHVFTPAIGDIFQGPDMTVYEIVKLQPWDWVGAVQGNYLHWIGLVNRTHRLLPAGFGL